jgi:hypothetical protein
MFGLTMILALFILYLIARDRFHLYQALVSGVFETPKATEAE